MTVWKGISNAALIVIGVAALGGVAYAYSKPLKEYSNLTQKKHLIEAAIQKQQAQLDDLKQRQERLQTDPRFAEKLARERFGYCKPGEMVFKFEGDAPPTSASL